MNRKDEFSISAVPNYLTAYGNIFPVPTDQKKNLQYSREFLMQLRTSPLSLQKPKELPSNEIVRNTLSNVWESNKWNKPFNISNGYVRQGFINDPCVIDNSKYNLNDISEEDTPSYSNFEEKRQCTLQTQPITLSDFKFQNHASMKETDQTVNKIKVMEESHQEDSHLYCVSKCRKSSAESHKDNDVTLVSANETIPYFLSHSLNCLLEHLNEANQDIGSLVHDLYCLHAVLCLAKNCTIAISLTWENLSEIIGPLITDGILPLSFTQDTSDLCFKPGCINCFCSFVSAILKGISEKKGVCDLNKLGQSEDLQCSTKMKVPASNFVNADNVITQVHQHRKNIVDWNWNNSETGYYPKNSSQVMTNKREDEVKNSLRTLNISAIQLQRACEKAIATVKTLNVTVKPRKPCRNFYLSTEQLKAELDAGGETGQIQVDSSSTTREEKKDVALRGNPDLTELEIEKRAKALLDEFLHNTDFQEAILYVSEICAPTTISFFVTYAFNCGLERSAQTRQQIGQLMHDLIKAKVMTAEQYIKGLQAILSLAEDYAIDIPHIWEYLGELIAPLIKDGTLPMSFLQDAAQSCIETGCDGALVSAVLHAVSKKLKLEFTDVRLNKSDNAWKPTYKFGKDTNTETLKTEDLYKKVRGILNKLTPQKFQTLVNQVNDLLIDTEERLKGVIDLVFEKALDEPNFSVAYANLCKCLAMKKVPIGNKDNDFANFRKLLLNKCQKEFERDTADDVARIKRAKEQHPDDEVKKRELDEELEDLERKAKRRSLGNIRFIGELFKLHMITASIMHDCLKKLLNQEDEDSLECLCRLLTTIGKDMDSEKGKSNNKEPEDKMNGYFRQMQEIVKKRQTSPRVRFMLQDLIDWRQNNWVPRRDENDPKTLDQIHLEAEREAIEREMSKTQPQSHRRINMGGGGSSVIGEDGWNTLDSKNSNRIDPQKLKLSKVNVDDDIQLGLGGRNVVGWSRGSSGGSRTSSQEPESKSSTPANRFQALASETNPRNEYSRRGVSRNVPSASRDCSKVRGTQMAPPAQLGGKAVQSQKEREQAIAAIKTIAGGETGRIQVDFPLRGNPDLTELEIEKRAKALLDEFLHNTDFQKLEFTVKPREPCKNTNLSSEQLKVELAALFASKQTENEEIFHWIDAHLNESQCKDSSFVRAIVSAVCQSVLDKSDDTTITVDESLFRNRCNILRKYLDQSEPCEMQALYALQALMHQLEQPKGVFNSFFDFLYDEEIISEDAFLLWEISEDPVEQEGKCMALNSVRSFYVWLKEAEYESVDES